MNTKLRKLCSMTLVLIAMSTVTVASATDILINPNSSFVFTGNLAGEMGDVNEVLEDFSVPFVLPSSALPFTSQSNETTPGGNASASYVVNITSDFLPAFDVLTLQLDLGVSGIVSGSWGTWSASDSDLDGNLSTEFEISDWTQVQVDVSVAWSFFDDVNLNHNDVRIVGPLNTVNPNQSGYLYELQSAAPVEWWNHSSTGLLVDLNLVPGVYQIEIDSSVTSFPTRSGSNTSSAAMDLQNDVVIGVVNTFDPATCPAGSPCAAIADIDGQNGVNLLDFVLWYGNQVDVNSDGRVSTKDEAAMAYLTGQEMVDADENGIIDAVDDYMTVSGVDDRMVATRAMELHAAYPNPFNPKTMLSFTLAQNQTVSLAVYDVKGRLVRTLLSSELRFAGLNEVSWDGRDNTGQSSPAGTYFFRLNSDDGGQSGRMLLLK